MDDPIDTPEDYEEHLQQRENDAQIIDPRPVSEHDRVLGGTAARMLSSDKQQKCIACLNIRFLDKDGLCATCSPSSPEMRKALLDLLKPKETL